MLANVKAVLFDVDGVLLDSLPQHLRISHDKANEYGLKLTIPTATELRKLVLAGEKISPMKHFFHAIGFPDDAAEKASRDYEAHFARDYPVKMFSGVSALLEKLAANGLKLGLVTANTRANVAAAMGKTLRFFEAEAMMFFGDPGAPSEKPEMLGQILTRLGLHPNEAVYVGDQPRDFEAAVVVGMPFLGVTYGWGFGKGCKYPFPTAHAPDEVLEQLSNVSHAA